MIEETCDTYKLPPKGRTTNILQRRLAMSETILIGRGRQLTSITRRQWEEQLSKVPTGMKTRLSFMTRQHHLVRYFVVRTLPRFGKPIPPEVISAKLSLPLPRVIRILGELEERLFFLVRNQHGHVVWAYPVTAEKTPHRLTFSSGERIHAA
jgi:hypothetical protein